MRLVSLRKPLVWTLSVAVVAGLAIGIPDLYRIGLLGSGFKAHMLCSGVFVSRREPQNLLDEDLTGPGYELLNYFDAKLEPEAKRVTASFHGLAQQTAIYRQGLGCTLIDGRTEEILRAEASDLFAPEPPYDRDALWPVGERVDLTARGTGVDGAALDAAVTAAFAEPESAHPRRTRALVVVHEGRIVAERYAPGFDAAMPLIGWSMTKIATNALIGLAVKDGRLNVDDKTLMPEWRGPDDPRREIRLDDLLRMESGLAFDETHDDDLSDVAQMLFVKGNMAEFAASKPLDHTPGSFWFYSSGSTVMVARILGDTFADARDSLRFPRERLFGPLGMRTAVLEPDASGTFIGASFMFASARDWARLALLFLQDGFWQGGRLLPEGWVAYSLTPAKAAPDRQYGAQVWLKLPESEGLGEPPMPEDAYYLLGHDGQVAAVVPSRDLVIVRLGLTREGGDWENARDLGPIVMAFPRSVTSR